MKRRWESDKRRQQVSATIRAEVDARSYTRELFESRRNTEASQEARPAPQPTKAQLRAEATEAIAVWEVAHPRPAPWGPWTEWRTVTRPDGTTYQERERQRQPRQ